MAEELKAIPPLLRNEEKENRVNAYLDAGHGDCVWRQPEVAAMAQQSLLHFADARYHLHAWCIMPSHVHILLQPMNGITLSTSMSSWKKFTGRRVSEWRQEHHGDAPAPAGHREYFDRYIHDEGHTRAVVDCIHRNPVRAGLVQKPEDWEWSSARLWLQR